MKHSDPSQNLELLIKTYKKNEEESTQLIIKLDNKLADVRAELENTKKELESTKTELEQSRNSINKTNSAIDNILKDENIKLKEENKKLENKLIEAKKPKHKKVFKQ